MIQDNNGKENFNEVKALKERELLLREREAKVRVMELSNLEKERELRLQQVV